MSEEKPTLIQDRHRWSVAELKACKSSRPVILDMDRLLTNVAKKIMEGGFDPNEVELEITATAICRKKLEEINHENL